MENLYDLHCFFFCEIKGVILLDEDFQLFFFLFSFPIDLKTELGINYIIRKSGKFRWKFIIVD